MGLIQAFSGAIKGTFADQWIDIIGPSSFGEQTAVVPGIFQKTNNGYGANNKGSKGVISSGSKIYVPENTAAFIFSSDGIEEIITEPGGYEYQSGTASIFNRDGIKEAIIDTSIERFKNGGQAENNKRIAYVNLRELRNIKFGTKGPILYNDLYYGVDLEIRSFGMISIQIKDPKKFILNFVPANTSYYSFSDFKVKEQIIAEFLHSYAQALSRLSDTARVSKLISHSDEVHEQVLMDSKRAGAWLERFGFELVGVSISNIELTEDSKELINEYSSTKLNLRAYEDVSDAASNRAAQQKISGGVEKNGLGDGGASMLFGMNYAHGLGSNAEQNISNDQPHKEISFDEQVKMLNQLKSLLDSGILTQDEFDSKKKDILGL